MATPLYVTPVTLPPDSLSDTPTKRSVFEPAIVCEKVIVVPPEVEFCGLVTLFLAIAIAYLYD